MTSSGCFRARGRGRRGTRRVWSCAGLLSSCRKWTGATRNSTFARGRLTTTYSLSPSAKKTTAIASCSPKTSRVKRPSHPLYATWNLSKSHSPKDTTISSTIRTMRYSSWSTTREKYWNSSLTRLPCKTALTQHLPIELLARRTRLEWVYQHSQNIRSSSPEGAWSHHLQDIRLQTDCLCSQLTQNAQFGLRPHDPHGLSHQKVPFRVRQSVAKHHSVHLHERVLLQYLRHAGTGSVGLPTDLQVRARGQSTSGALAMGQKDTALRLLWFCQLRLV